MRRILAIAALIATAACTDPYGNIDPLATGLAVGVGAAAVGALGYAAGQSSAPRYNYYAAPRHHYRAAPRYPGGYRGGYPAHPRYNPYRRW